jgi:hypothetical protein
MDAARSKTDSDLYSAINMNNQLRSPYTKPAKPKRAPKTGFGLREIRQLAQLLDLGWSRFDWKRTDRAGRKRLLAYLRGRHVSFSLKGPCTHEDVLRKICEEADIPIKCLPPELSKRALARGQTIFDWAGRALDKIAFSFEGMQWWFSEGGLVMDIVSAPPEKDFRSVAGKMLVALRQSLPDQTRLSKDQYLAFAARLDELGFTPLKVLPGKWAKQLADWNQKNSLRAITTFQQAIYAKAPKFLHSALLEVFYDSEEKVKRNQR